MLKVKFNQIKNVVIMEILEQSDEDTINLADSFIASNEFEIESCDHPEIDCECKIYVRGAGDICDVDKLSCYDFESVKDAEKFIKEACEAIKEYNTKFNFTPASLEGDALPIITTIAE